MTTKIYIDPAAFDAGSKLYGMSKGKARIMAGNADTNNNINGSGIGIKYTLTEMDNLVSRASITITVNPIEVDDNQFDEWSRHMKLSLASLVDKGLIIVERPPGVAMTSAAIRS